MAPYGNIGDSQSNAKGEDFAIYTETLAASLRK